MSSELKNSDDETSRLNEESSSSGSEQRQEGSVTETNISGNSSQSLCSESTKPAEGALAPSEEVNTDETPEMKRASAKKLIERYFYQLLDGCGNEGCANKYCASSGQVEKMTPNQAAARAIQLFSQEATLCDIPSSKIARSSSPDRIDGTEYTFVSAVREPVTVVTAGTQTLPCSGQLNREGSTGVTSDSADTLLRTPADTSRSVQPPSDVLGSKMNNGSHSTKSKYDASRWAHVPSSISESEIEKIKETALDEQVVDELIDWCKRENSHAKLIRTLGEVFSSNELLSKSFFKLPSAPIDDLLDGKAPSEWKKEELRSLEGETDKDEDCTAEKVEVDEVENPSYTTVNLPSLRRSMKKLFQIDALSIFESINNGLHSLSIVLGVDLLFNKDKLYIESIIHTFVVVFEMSTLASSEFVENGLSNVCRAASRLPIWAQARLARIWATHCKSSLSCLIQTLQQLISIQVITGDFGKDGDYVQENDVITSTTKVLKIAYYANILAGQLETTKAQESESDPVQEDFFAYNQTAKPNLRKIDDELETELGVSVLDSRVPLVPFEEFYNEPLSDVIEMDNDYLCYKNLSISSRGDKRFTFMLYSFILTPATKVVALYYDSRIRMYSERRSTLFYQNQYYGDNLSGPNPHLKLKVRRENIIDDALVELEVIAMGSPKDFKKQLVVEFVGEEGIDEGGVSKEFFQLVVEEIFNPDFGMFISQEDTNTMWFNSTSFENEAQFTLIGIVVGLAIYNNIILAVNFPMVVYRKLMGGHGSFYDLADWNPVLHRNLKSLLDYEENDMEEVFMQTFKISYKDIFGTVVEHELKPGGGDILVNQENKQEFVDLYSDFLLNKSIERPFRAFKRGFEMVTDESPLKLLFRPEEIELLVCGSRQFDFFELEKSTEYDGGYSNQSKIIIDFWAIVHSLPMESKRKLLEFTTGSDRVPVGGLSRLKLVISRNGPDSDRLPTSHTCFNVLLLPEYDSKDKLEDRLLKAINYSKGFGML